MSAGLRAVSPALATSIYATGVKYHIAGGQLFWIVAVALALGQLGTVRLLPREAEGRIERAVGEEEENGA